MRRTRPWIDLGALTALAGAALLLDPNGHQPPQLPLMAGLVAGFAAGVALAFGVTSRGRRVVRSSRRRRPGTGSTLAVATVLVVTATGEEIVWRWTALDLLAGSFGTLAALAASSVGFSLAHGCSWRTARLHSLTGATFGLVYLSTGRLSAAVATHAAYNTALLAIERRRGSAVVTAALVCSAHETTPRR